MASTRLPVLAVVAGLLLGGMEVRAGTPRFAVTVYNKNLGLVRERRVVAVEKGESVYAFRDVAAQIDPTSVHFRPADGKGGLEVLEQNYEYDLVSSEKIFQKYLEHPVDVYFARSGDVAEGTLLSASRGGVILQNGEGGRLTVVMSDIRDIELKGEVSDFVTRPTLVWTLQSDRAGEREVEVEYLTGGMNWHAEYVALAGEKNEALDFAGWVSVENRSGGAYEDAKLKLVAGDVNRVGPYVRGGRSDETRFEMAAKTPMVEERALFEYHLYTVKRPTTIRKNQVKQIAFVPNVTVPVKKEYLLDSRKDPERVAVYFVFENDEEGGLGIALPAGVVRVFQDDGEGGSEFIGEDRIDHTPRNEEVRLKIGNAFDIVAERKTLDEKRPAGRVRERTVEIRLRNRKEEPVEVKVWEGIEGEWKIEKETFAHRKEDAHTAEWIVPIGADTEAVLEYTVRIRY